MPLLFRSHLCQSITACRQTLLLHSGSHLNYSTPFPRYAKPLFTLPMLYLSPLCLINALRFCSVHYLTSPYRCFAILFCTSQHAALSMLYASVLYTTLLRLTDALLFSSVPRNTPPYQCFTLLFCSLLCQYLTDQV